MKAKNFFIKITAIITVLSLGLVIPAKNAYADSVKVVTIGADLNSSQKQSMLDYFGVKEKEVNIVTVTNEEEKKYLSSSATSEQIGSRAISCSYIEPTSSGGIDVKTNNITWATENMIKNCMITAGIENAKVVVSAPFKVSGTAALTGILKGFENSSAGEKIDEDKKEAANEELVVTGDLGDKIGADEAAGIINEVKKNVVKENPSSKEDIEKIVKDTINSYSDIKAKLSDEDIQKITELMEKINSLNLNFSKLQSQLNDVSSMLKDKLGSEEAQGFLQKLGQFFSGIFDFFKNLFN